MQDFTSVDQMVYQYIGNRTFPGAVMYIANSKQIIYNKTYGNFKYSGDSQNQQVKYDTYYDLASVTKVQATTPAIMLLYDQGKIKLDDLLVSYIPEAKNNGKDQITILNLLLHNSGLRPDYPFNLAPGTTPQVVKNFIYNLPLQYPTGTQYVYSDFNMILLAEVILRITGQQIDQFLQDNLYSKLEMSSTLYTPNDTIKQQCAPAEMDFTWRYKLIQGIVHDPSAYALGGVTGNAGLFSIGQDAIKYMQVMLNNGTYTNQANQKIQIFQPDTVTLFTTKYQGQLPYQNSRALGWDTVPFENPKPCGDYFSPNSFGHTGFTGITVWADKDKDLAIIILTNRVYAISGPTVYPIRYFRKNIYNQICQVLGYTNNNIDNY